MFTHLKAAEAWLKAGGGLPVNVKYLIEGEEEVGGANLEAFVAANRAKLACDYAVISDTSQFAPGIPAITYGLKGLAYFELVVEGAKSDLHSGMFGGTVANPLNALSSLLAEPEGSGRPDPGRGVLRPGPDRSKPGSAPSSPGSRSPTPSSWPRSAPRRWRGRSATRPWSGVGPGQPATSTAFTAATRGPGPRPSSPARPGRS